MEKLVSEYKIEIDGKDNFKPYMLNLQIYWQIVAHRSRIQGRHLW